MANGDGWIPVCAQYGGYQGIFRRNYEMRTAFHCWAYFVYFRLNLTLRGEKMPLSLLKKDNPDSEESTPAQSAHTFFVISVKKFMVLYFMTMGLYSIVWFYEHWKQYRLATGIKVWPAVRAFFGALMIFSLFSKVQKSLSESGRAYEWSPVMRGALILAITVVCIIFSVIGNATFIPAWLVVVNVMILGVLGFLLAGAQRAINFLEADPEGHSNSTLSFANGIWAGVFGYLWLGWIIIFFTAINLKI